MAVRCSQRLQNHQVLGFQSFGWVSRGALCFIHTKLCLRCKPGAFVMSVVPWVWVVYCLLELLVSR